MKKEKKFLFLVFSLFCILPTIVGTRANTQAKPFFDLTQSKDCLEAHETISETKPQNMQVQHQVLQFSSTSNSSKFSRHVMCKGWDSSFNPIEPTTIFSPSDTKAVCLTTVSINDTIEFRWYYRSNSSKTWVSCYNWSAQAISPGEYCYEGYLLIAGYWPGMYYPRAYKVEVYLDGSFSFSDFFEVTNGGLSSPRMCENIDANGLPVNIKSRFTIGVDARAYYYLRFDKIAYFNEEYCHNFTTVWVQPDGTTYKTRSASFDDYKDTNVTWNYWNYKLIQDDYITINSSTPVGNWKVEVYLDSYFNNTWTAYGPVATTSFVVGNTTVADWTFMIYLDADINNQTSAEEAGIATFIYIAKTGSSPPKVNVIVQMDRMSGSSGYGNWTDCKRFYVTKGMTPTPGNATMDLGEVDMADPDTLKDFVNWTIQSYPANYYCLVLWDHGAGVMGLCLDFTPQPTDCLYLPELSQALSGLPAIMDVVFLDACSMGMAEVAYQIKDYANVLIAPEGLGYAPAPYNYYLSGLTSNSSISPNTFAKEIVTDYIAWCDSTPAIQEATMSAADLTKITSLTAAINDFAIILKEKETPYHELISMSRNLTEGYPGPYANQTGYYIDLYQFAQLTHQYIQDGELDNAAYQVMTALSIGNVIILDADKSYTNSHGLSIFFPDKNEKYDECKSVYEETAFVADTIWDEFIQYDLSGYVLTIQTPYPNIIVKIDEDSYATDANGKIDFFSLPSPIHTINVTTPVSTGSGTRGVFVQWNDNSTLNPRMLHVSRTMKLQAQYKIQYRLIVNADFGTTEPPVGEHWYDANSVVSINATASNANSSEQYTFDYWSVDGTDKGKGVNPITVTMDKPYEVTAHYVRVAGWWAVLSRLDVQIILGLASAALAIVLVRTAWLRTAKKRTAMQPPLKPAVEVSKVVLPGRVTSGYADLDLLLFGGIPENYAVILTSPSCDERDVIVKRFLEAGTKNNEATFYITNDPGEVKSLAEEFQSTFHLFVCNPRADAMVESLPNTFKLKGVENLTEINIALTKAFRPLEASPSGSKRACVEIISDILLQHHAVQTRRWLTDLVAEMKSRGFTVLAVMNPQMHPSEEVHAILDLFDGEINICEKETEKGLEKFLRVKKMTGQKYSTDELPLKKEGSA